MPSRRPWPCIAVSLALALALAACPPAESPAGAAGEPEAGLVEGPSQVELPPLPEADPTPPPADPEPGVVPVRPPDSRPTGTLAPAQLGPELARIRARVHDCYSTGLSRDPALGGRVVVRLTVEQDGRVSRAEPHEAPTLGDAQVVTCIQDVLRTAIFPAPRGGRALVLVPYEFAPPDAGATTPEAGTR